MINLFFIAIMLQTSPQDTSRCTRETIYKIVDRLVKKNKIEFDYKKTIKETKYYYLVEYMPKDTLILGGGIKVTICKNSCKVIDYKLYQ